jgi:glycosyltransferase involved in cell wall biosynthesis
MTTRPKVSVIIPTHNRSAFLRSAIISVLNQTFQDFEIIIIDDASKDDTRKVITSFNEARIRGIHNQASKGAAGSRNIGVTNAQGEYIAFLDDDDEWLPAKLERQARLLDDSPPEVGGICTGRLVVEKASGRVWPVENHEHCDLSKRNFITTSSLLLRRRCFDECGLFDDEMPTGSDYDMWIRISKRFSFKIIGDNLVTYHVHDDCLTWDYAKKIRGIEMLLAKYDSVFRQHPKEHSRQYLQLGVYYCYQGEVQKGRKAFSTAIRINPCEIRNYFNFGLSLLGAEHFKRLKSVKEKVFFQ